jgi:hypothetical protein
MYVRKRPNVTAHLTSQRVGLAHAVRPACTNLICATGYECIHWIRIIQLHYPIRIIRILPTLATVSDYAGSLATQFAYESSPPFACAIAPDTSDGGYIPPTRLHCNVAHFRGYNVAYFSSHCGARAISATFAY